MDLDQSVAKYSSLNFSAMGNTCTRITECEKPCLSDNFCTKRSVETNMLLMKEFKPTFNVK